MNWNDPKQRSLAMIRGKGWSAPKVSSAGGTYFKAVARKNGVNISGGGSRDFNEAVAIAISLAVKHQCIDWSKTREWLEIAGLRVSSEDVVSQFNRTQGGGRYGRGWSIARLAPRKPTHSACWSAIVGPTRRRAERSFRRATKLGAVRAAVALAKTKPYYGEDATREWLIREGLEDKVNWKLKNKAQQ